MTTEISLNLEKGKISHYAEKNIVSAGETIITKMFYKLKRMDQNIENSF